MAHYLFRGYNNLPNYYGDAYIPPMYAAWSNYTVPFSTPPGWFYSPHPYAPRNTFEVQPSVPCKETPDARWCPMIAGVKPPTSQNVSMCVFGGQQISSAEGKAECQRADTWSESALEQLNE